MGDSKHYSCVGLYSWPCAACSLQPGLGAVCTSSGHWLFACSDTTFPMNFRVVEYFKQNPQADGPRVLVQLREWTPDWAQLGQCLTHYLPAVPQRCFPLDSFTT
jgi:hypothetical protein